MTVTWNNTKKYGVKGGNPCEPSHYVKLPILFHFNIQHFLSHLFCPTYFVPPIFADLKKDSDIMKKAVTPLFQVQWVQPSPTVQLVVWVAQVTPRDPRLTPATTVWCLPTMTVTARAPTTLRAAHPQQWSDTRPITPATTLALLAPLGTLTMGLTPSHPSNTPWVSLINVVVAYVGRCGRMATHGSQGDRKS